MIVSRTTVNPFPFKEIYRPPLIKSVDKHIDLKMQQNQKDINPLLIQNNFLLYIQILSCQLREGLLLILALD